MVQVQIQLSTPYNTMCSHYSQLNLVVHPVLDSSPCALVFPGEATEIIFPLLSNGTLVHSLTVTQPPNHMIAVRERWTVT